EPLRPGRIEIDVVAPRVFHADTRREREFPDVAGRRELHLTEDREDEAGPLRRHSVKRSRLVFLGEAVSRLDRPTLVEMPSALPEARVRGRSLSEEAGRLLVARRRAEQLCEHERTRRRDDPRRQRRYALQPRKQTELNAVRLEKQREDRHVDVDRKP